MKQKVVIATRKSRLALWQAEFIADLLVQHHPGLITELLPMTTQGDNRFAQPLPPGGGKGLFTKELEHALLNQTADIAVHSMKDVATNLPPDLIIAAMPKRENPADAFVSERYPTLAALPKGAVVGTASLRRQCQIKHHYPQLVIKPLRGNVNTRLEKLKTGKYDAIILACAGLIRLGYSDTIREALALDKSLPAIGQGAIGIECRVDDAETQALLQPLNHAETACCVEAERAVNRNLGGDCRSPLAAYAQLDQGQLQLSALVGSIDGKQLLSTKTHGTAESAQEVGTQAAETLRQQGADELLAEIY